MIRVVLTFAARLVFNAALVALTLSLVLGYASYRLLRSTVTTERGQPVREASFAVLAAVVVLSRALAARRSARPPTSEEDNHADLADI